VGGAAAWGVVSTGDTASELSRRRASEEDDRCEDWGLCRKFDEEDFVICPSRTVIRAGGSNSFRNGGCIRYPQPLHRRRFLWGYLDKTRYRATTTFVLIHGLEIKNNKVKPSLLLSRKRTTRASRGILLPLWAHNPHSV